MQGLRGAEYRGMVEAPLFHIVSGSERMTKEKFLEKSSDEKWLRQPAAQVD